MIKIKSKLKNLFENGPVPYEVEAFLLKRRDFRSGFVILYTVVVSSILLAITLGVGEIAFKELRFGTSAKDTNDSFFAADTGLERALLLDKPPAAICPLSSGACTIDLAPFLNLGTTGKGCAKVRATKSTDPSDGSIKTHIVSKGYHSDDPSCSGSNTNRIERQLEIKY